MDQYVKFILTISVVSFAATARSHYGIKNTRVDRDLGFQHHKYWDTHPGWSFPDPGRHQWKTYEDTAQGHFRTRNLKIDFSEGFDHHHSKEIENHSGEEFGYHQSNNDEDHSDEHFDHHGSKEDDSHSDEYFDHDGSKGDENNSGEYFDHHRSKDKENHSGEHLDYHRSQDENHSIDHLDHHHHRSKEENHSVGDFRVSPDRTERFTESWQATSATTSVNDLNEQRPLRTTRSPGNIQTPGNVKSPENRQSPINTQSPMTILLCIRACVATPEYNPVCGTNNVTYSNIGRLECSRNCGVDVQLRDSSRCPPPTPANNSPTTGNTASNRPTPAPINLSINDANTVKPTRFTTINISSSSTNKPGFAASGTTIINNGSGSGFTIPYDVLSSIFTNPSSETSTEFDIDIRQNEKK